MTAPWRPQPGADDTWRGLAACPWCGTEHDAASAIQRQANGKRAAPAEGDCSMCWQCGRASTFTAEGARRLPTQAELDRFLGDSGVAVAVAVWSLAHGGRWPWLGGAPTLPAEQP